MSTWINKHIGILMGGSSSEREISLWTGEHVLKALQSKNYKCTGIDWNPAQKTKKGVDQSVSLMIEQQIKTPGVDVVWNALHGTYGEDGYIQQALSDNNIPYTGSTASASRLAFNKQKTKQILQQHNIHTPPDINDDTPWTGSRIIKPNTEGSSIGVSVVHDQSKYKATLQKAKETYDDVLVEPYLDGPELQVGLLDTKVLGTIEIQTEQGLYDYTAKYNSKTTQYIIPPHVPQALCQQAQDMAQQAFCVLKCRGHARIDIRMDQHGHVFVLEINTLPGMTPVSLLPKIAAHFGMDYTTLCVEILNLADI